MEVIVAFEDIITVSKRLRGSIHRMLHICLMKRPVVDKNAALTRSQNASITKCELKYIIAIGKSRC